MREKPEQLYIDLMKKTLSFSLWPEPPSVIANYTTKFQLIRTIIENIAKLVNQDYRVVCIALKKKFTKAQIMEGREWPGYADTMIGLKRLENLQFCIETVLDEGIEGDFIETGVWRGGACIFMRAILAAYGIEGRKVFVADSFQGLPKSDDSKYPADKDDVHHGFDFLSVTRAEVENNFKKYGLLDDQVVFLQGWFADTLPTAPIEKLSVLRLDADMYGSTIEVLECLYPKLSKGGFCIIDDYALHGCQLAVNDYREKHQISAEFKEIDWTGKYWRKE